MCGATRPWAGWKCRQLTPAPDVGAANRDPAHFEAPDEFRLDRSGAKGHVTFGKGVHFCVGAALARLEAQIVFRTLLDHTNWIDVADVGEWLPSILVRRFSRLELAIQ